MSGNASVAEDVTQEVFMVLIRDAKRFDPTRGTLGGFLFGVARNHLRKRWEHDRRSVPLADDSDKFGHPATTKGEFARGNGDGASASPQDDFASAEIAARVRGAIATLPENYREVAVLCDLEEMSYEEAAAMLDCPVGTIRSRLHRARAILLEKLREVAEVRPTSAVNE